MALFYRKSLSVGVLAASIAVALGAHAASGNAGTDSANFDQEQVESFAEARAEVRQLQQEYTTQLQQADGKQAEQLRKEAQQEMTEAVEDTSLSVKEYNRIAQAARNDQELSEQIRNASK